MDAVVVGITGGLGSGKSTVCALWKRWGASVFDSDAVAKRLMAFVGGSEFYLVETLAERCAEIVLNEFNVDWLTLRLDKPGAVTGSKSVGVMIERGRRPG